MKYFLLFVFVLFVTSFTAYSQKASCAKYKLVEMAALLKFNAGDFDTKVTGRCYGFSKSGESETGAFKIYNWTKDEAALPDIIQYGTAKPTGIPYISYSTMNLEKYTHFKAEIKKLKFLFISEVTKDKDQTHFRYANGKYNLLIILNATAGSYRYTFTIEEIRKPGI